MSEDFWSNKDHLTCYYCKLTHDLVEAGGIWHCPNPLCTGPGAAYWRSQCKSYKEVSGDRETVDPLEMVEFAMAKMATETDAALKEHVLRSVARWLPDESLRSER